MLSLGAWIGRTGRRVTALMGECPPIKSNRTSGVALSWLLTHRVECPQDADPRTVEQYARAYLWFLLTEVVFPACSGDNALWMYLDFLADWDAGYSWGSPGLAYLYCSVRHHTSHLCVWFFKLL